MRLGNVVLGNGLRVAGDGPAEGGEWVTDLERAYTLSTSFGLRPLSATESECDISLASDSLRYAFDLPWGSETLEINARYRTPSKEARYAFFDQFRPARRINHGYAPLRFRDLGARIAGRLTGRSSAPS